MKQVVAFEAFGIFGDYDGNAPDTATICLVSSEELAKLVCASLNEDPRKHNIVFVDGWESSKMFSYRRELTDSPASVCETLENALGICCDGESDDSDSDDSGDDVWLSD